jgi:hypothetical protein
LKFIADNCFQDDKVKQARNDKTVHDSYGYVAILQVMTKWKNVLGVQRQGCRALYNVSYANVSCDNRKCDFAEKSVSLGAFQDVITTMDTFKNDEDIQCFGSAALSLLSYNSRARLRLLFLKHNGASVLAAAMKAFPHNVKLQVSCSLAFDNASEWQELVKAVLKTDAFNLLNTAISNHKNEDDVRRFAASAAKRLSKHYNDGFLK